MDKDYKEKIKKLLALAESPNEHEARAALLKARQLMAEHKIEEADLKDLEKQKVVKKIIDGITCSKRREPWIIDLSDTITRNYCCQGYRVRGYGKQTFNIGIIGFEEDAEIAEAVFLYAVDCVRSKIKQIKAEYAMYHRRYVKSLCDSYGMGFTYGLLKMFEQQQKDNEAGWGLVLVIPKEVEEAASFLNAADFKANINYSRDMLREGIRDGENFRPERRLQEDLQDEIM